MQRKNHILKQRRGFAMIMAIFFMIIIATLLLYMLAGSSETSQRTTNDYLSEQAVLMAKSATEYAILAVSGHDRVANNNCVNSISAQYPQNNPIFDINTTIRYIGFGNTGFGANCDAFIQNINTPESNGTMLIDVYVRSNGSLNLTEPISHHRRTLQKL